MRVFNQDKTKELFNYDYSKGYTIKDTLTKYFKGQNKIEEQGHYEVIAEYPNGGKDIEWVIDVPGQNEILEHNEIEDILIYIEYTAEEIKYINDKQNINKNKKFLETTDYIIAKISEKKILGLNIDEDLIKYNNVIAEREKKRTEINFLENECLNLKISNYVKEKY